MAQFAEVLDEIQITPNSSGIEQQRQSNPTILSKFRHSFLPNTKQTTSRRTIKSILLFLISSLFKVENYLHFQLYQNQYLFNHHKNQLQVIKYYYQQMIQ
jgi:hypothetical protein